MFSTDLTKTIRRILLSCLLQGQDQSCCCWRMIGFTSAALIGLLKSMSGFTPQQSWNIRDRQMLDGLQNKKYCQDCFHSIHRMLRAEQSVCETPAAPGINHTASTTRSFNSCSCQERRVNSCDTQVVRQPSWSSLAPKFSYINFNASRFFETVIGNLIGSCKEVHMNLKGNGGIWVN